MLMVWNKCEEWKITVKYDTIPYYRIRWLSITNSAEKYGYRVQKPLGSAVGISRDGPTIPVLSLCLSPLLSPSLSPWRIATWRQLQILGPDDCIWRPGNFTTDAPAFYTITAEYVQWYKAVSWVQRIGPCLTIMHLAPHPTPWYRLWRLFSCTLEQGMFADR